MRTLLSSSRFGIPPARNATSLSLPCTTEMQTAPLSFTISLNLYVHQIYNHHRAMLIFLQASLDKAKAWVKELQRQANENIVIALAGNKLDLVTEQPDKRAIPTADAEAYAREAGLLFFETSAKTAENVQTLFTAIAKKLPLDQAGPRHARPGQRPGVSLAPENSNTNVSGPCSC
ncbi:Ras family protein [Fusarium oxysporum f. sp. phaseoli]